MTIAQQRGCEKENQNSGSSSTSSGVASQKIHCIFFRRIAFFLLLFVVEAQQYDSIPGCPALSTIANVDSYNGSFCFCNVRDRDFTDISCFYSSTVEQFKRALFAASAAKKTVKQVTLSRVRFDDGMLPGKIFDSLYAPIEIISIDKCVESITLNIQDDSFHGLAEHLQELYITECNLEQFPRTAIQNLTKLKTLSLAYNKLTRLVLDMGRADGITNITEGIFGGLSKLEKLLLPGCSLTIIHKNTFQGLIKLTELDLRINLLNEVECGSFVWTPNLQRLSLAGNYLNESLACWWDGLEYLKELDLGWNEFSVLENNAFFKLGPSLSSLNLRHNKRLIHIDENAFNGLRNLNRLNMSETSITELNNTLRHLPSLKELDLSNGKLQYIEENDLEAQNEKLEELILRNNMLTVLSRSALEGMRNLRVLDLSNNQWLLVEEIELKYKEAILLDRDFTLLHSNETICNRPYSLRGQAVMNVIKDAFKMYNSSNDFHSTTSTILTVDNDVKLENISADLLNKFLAKNGLIGDEIATSEHHANTSVSIHSLYHINMETELVNEQIDTNSIPITVAVLILTIVSTAVIAAVIKHLRKQKSEANRRTSFEMRDKV
ncbi:unnamed protein product [Litomosoides sigmodontis]|uniref:LRRCT domain-containing protein n=1 Tax=Litomosoides sigmodontis TaxID=42156 RepID=A0A3P6TK04_LITSI|nr:unnamed protein product [Litomosoides sigmodontis]